MDSSLVGLIMVGIGSLVCCFGRTAAIYMSVISLAFPTTAAMSISALGDASVTIPQIGLLWLICATALDQGAWKRAAYFIGNEPAVVLLSLFTFVTLVGAFALPRAFADKVLVFGLARWIVPGETSPLLPLQPNSGNVTQSMYILGDFFMFMAALCLGTNPRNFRTIVRAIQYLISIQLLLTFTDAVGRYAFGEDLLSFMRTATYTMLTKDDINGIVRITGASSEASFLAVSLAGPIAYSFALWRYGLLGYWPPTAFSLSFGLLMIATSSSGYTFLAFFVAFVFVLAFAQLMARRMEAAVLWTALTMLGFGVLISGFVLFLPNWVPSQISGFLNTLLFNKMSTDSGLERSELIAQGLKNFADTFGFGIGLGSSRGASWIVVLVSQVGVLGTILFGSFLFALMRPRSDGVPADRTVGYRLASRAYVLATLVIVSITWPVLDLGLATYLVAAVGLCAVYVQSASPVVATDRQFGLSLDSRVASAADATSALRRI